MVKAGRVARQTPGFGFGMLRFEALLVCGVWCVAFSTAAALPPAERLLPADTLAFATAPDWTATRSNFNSSALGRFFADPSMKPFRDKLMTNIGSDKLGPMEKQLGVKFTDYADLARGQVTVALMRDNWDGSPDRHPGFLWLIDTRDKSAQARTNIADLRKKWIEKGNRLRADKVRDVDFTTFIIPAEAAGKPAQDVAADAKAKTPTEVLVGISDTLLVMGDSAKDIEKVLALQAGSSVPPLAEQAAFAANAPLARDSSAFVWVDVKSIVGAMSKQARDEQAPAPAQPSFIPPPPTVDKIFSALGLADVQTLAGALMENPDGAMVNLAINVPEGGRRGFFKILAVDQKDSSPPPFVPADAVKFSRWRIDLQKAWTTIESALNEINPMFGGSIKMLLDLAGKDKDPNFDLRKVLLSNLGDDIISYDKAPRPGGDPANPPSLTLIGSKNADQMAASLKAITSIIPPTMAKYEEREFLGRKVCSFTWPSMGGDGKATPITYSASGGYLAISSDQALVEEYLRSNEGKNKPLRDTPGLNEAAQKVGGMNSGFFAYENQAETMRSSFESAKKDPAAAATLPGVGKIAGALSNKPAETGSVTNWFDPSLLPPYDRVSKYFHMTVTAINVSPGAITFRVFAPTPPALRK